METNFNEAAACFSVGAALIITLISLIKSNDKDQEFDPVIFMVGVVLFGAPIWCVLVGLRWMIHNL